MGSVLFIVPFRRWKRVHGIDSNPKITGWDHKLLGTPLTAMVGQFSSTTA